MIYCCALHRSFISLSSNFSDGAQLLSFVSNRCHSLCCCDCVVHLHILSMCAHIWIINCHCSCFSCEMWVTARFFTCIFCLFFSPFLCVSLFMSLGCNVSSVSIISLSLSLFISYWLLRWNVEIVRHPNNCAFSNFYRHMKTKLCTCLTSRTSNAVGCFGLTCLNTCVDRLLEIHIAVSMQCWLKTSDITHWLKHLSEYCRFVCQFWFHWNLSRCLIQCFCWMWCNNQSNKTNKQTEMLDCRKTKIGVFGARNYSCYDCFSPFSHAYHNTTSNNGDISMDL